MSADRIRTAVPAPGADPVYEPCGAILLAVGLVFVCDEPKGHDGDHLCPEGVRWNEWTPGARGVS